MKNEFVVAQARDTSPRMRDTERADAGAAKESAVRVEALEFAYGKAGATRPALRGVDFEIGAGEIFGVTPDGNRVSFARFTDGDAPRGLAFVPNTPETRAAGLAGDLLVSVIRTGVFQLNQIVRISGPFPELARPR